MKTTTENMQTLMKNLQQIFTDVRLLDADTVNAIREGAYTSSASDVCYTCNTSTIMHAAVLQNRKLSS